MTTCNSEKMRKARPARVLGLILAAGQLMLIVPHLGAEDTKKVASQQTANLKAKKEIREAQKNYDEAKHDPTGTNSAVTLKRLQAQPQKTAK